MFEAAPLFATADAPVPAGAAAEWFTGAGRARLRAAHFPTERASRGSVVVSPGRTEPIEKYFEVAEILTARGYVALVHDWRGHGLSARPGGADRGDARGWGDYMADYASLLAAFEARLPRPWIALGHSMGGCLALLALALGESRFSGAILSAPMLGVQTGAFPQLAARLLAKTMTLSGLGSARAVREGPLPEPFESNVLTHDVARYRRNQEQLAAWPQLRVGPPTYGWLDFAFRSGDFLARGPGTTSIPIPITAVAAREDRVVDNASTSRVVARIAAGCLQTIDGAFHEILQETNAIQAQFWAEFDELAHRSGVN